MRLNQATNLDVIAERLRTARGECRWCGIGHPIGQCQQPKNWSSRSEPERQSGYAVFEANRDGEHWRYLRQLERQALRERILAIKI